MKLANKRILFIAPRFYGYDKRIKQALVEKGAKVAFEYTFICNRFLRFTKKFSNYFFEICRDEYYQQIVNKYEDEQLDFLFVLEGLWITPAFLKKFRDNHPNTQFIYYSWDSVRYFNYLPLRPYFDKQFTFDRNDSEQYKINYLPLFYSKEFEELSNRVGDTKFDLLFLASYHSERLRFIISFLDDNQDKLFVKVILYMSKYRYYLEKLKGTRIKKTMVTFKPLSFNSYIELLSKSKAVLDYTPSLQSGLPIRIIEAIGAGKKLITNNKLIERETSIQEMVKVYQSGDNLKSFLEEDIIYGEGIKGYSLDNWIKKIIED